MSKRKLAKAKKEPVDQGYPMISLEDVKTREVKYQQRLQDLSISTAFIEEALQEVVRLNAKRTKLMNWLKYLRCDGLPVPHSPPDIRLFFAKARFFEAENVEKTIDWSLSVNERSILTQNIFREDLTRKTLLETICPNFGESYEYEINRSLLIIGEIEHFLENENDSRRVSLKTISEILLLKTTIETEIKEFFDRYTYRIISAENSYMSTKDGVTADYCYEGANYAIHIWALRNVPILFTHLFEPNIQAYLYCVKVHVQLPFNILEDNLTLRCIHTEYDHCTSHAKSFEQVITKSTDNLNAGIRDIEECLINEWYTQVAIQNEIKEKMLKKRKEYEDLMQTIAEKEAQSAKEKRTEDDKKKKVRFMKTPKEVPSVPDNMFPDTYELFLEREQQQFVDLLNEFFHPNTLNLSPDEINLKKFIMLGGTYQMFFVEKPKQVGYESFTMTWQENDRKVKIRDVVSIINPDLNLRASNASKISKRRSDTRSRASTRSSRRSRIASVSRPSATRAGSIMVSPLLDDGIESPYFIVVFQLPRNLCLWGEPIACHYEEAEYAVEEDEDREKEDKISDMIFGKAKETPTSGPNVKYGHTENIEDDDPLMFKGMLQPRSRRANSQNVFRSSLSVLMRNSRVLVPGAENNFAIDNFVLFTELDKNDNRALQRYCLPRMISSFRFPKEIKEEMGDDVTVKAKTKGNVLIRRQEAITEDMSQYDDTNYCYEDQNGPERVFPYFAKLDDFFASHVPHPNASNTNTDTLFDILETFDDIQIKYKANYKKILDQPKFVPKKFLPKKVDKINFEAAQSQVSALTAKTKRDTRSKTSVQKSSIIPSKSRLTKDDLQGFDITHATSITDSWRSSESEEGSKIEENAEEALEAEVEINKKKKKVIKYFHWTTKYIVQSEFNKEQNTLTLSTDRLGVFGFAYKRYEHFPFSYWSLAPDEENPDEFIFILDTFHVRVRLTISSKGFRGYVTDAGTGFVAKPVKYMEIVEPVTDFKELKRIFIAKNVNIFAEQDASFYIENGYFSVKHLASELHTYECMALHCSLLKFRHSNWNRLAKRRSICFCFSNPKETYEGQVTVRVTPENSTFVEIKELCSDDLDVFKLDYQLTWRNIGVYADLHQLINSMYPQATDVRNKDGPVINFIKMLLTEIRPLSFS